MEKENLSRKSLLIVDDEEILRGSIRTNIRSYFDVNILEASSAQEAMRILDTTTVHAILTDIKLPGTDGIEFFSQIRLKGVKAPVIFITGTTERENVIKALRLGALDFIEKPFPKKILIDAVTKALKTHESHFLTCLQKLDLNSTRIRILECVLTGMSNKEIASRMHLSEQGIKYHVGHLLKKFIAKNRAELKAKVLDIITPRS